MPRLHPPQQPNNPYHITARCINRQWFDLPLQHVWEVMSEQLYFVRFAYNFRVLAFVLMGNHFHMLARTPDSNLGESMSFFMRETSRELVRRAGRINQAWGGPFFRCMLTKNSHFLNTYKYIYRNPVSAGVVDTCESYPFSTLHGLLGFQHLLMPVEHDSLLFTPTLDLNHLSWLNSGNLEDEFEITKALRKTSFQFRKPSGYPSRPADFVY